MALLEENGIPKHLYIKNNEWKAPDSVDLISVLGHTRVMTYNFYSHSKWKQTVKIMLFNLIFQ